MTKKIIPLSLQERKHVLSLLEKGIELNDCLELLNLEKNRYDKSKRTNNSFKTKVSKLKNRPQEINKGLFLQVLDDTEGNMEKTLRKLSITEDDVKKWSRNDKDFRQTKNLVVEKHRVSFKTKKSLIRNNPNIQHLTEVRNGLYYVDKGGKVVYKRCSKCREVKSFKNYYYNKNSDSKITSRCIDCLSKSKIGRVVKTRGVYDFKKKRPRYKFNSKGNTIERFCNNCDKVKRLEEFEFLHQKIPFCKDCFNTPKKPRKEFSGLKQIRWYDDQDNLIKKRCPRCGFEKTPDSFSIYRRSFYDGLTTYCKSCLNDSNSYLKKKKQLQSQSSTSK